MAAPGPLDGSNIDGLNGYAPEKEVFERICSGIMGLRNTVSVCFSIVLGVFPTEK